MKKQLVLAIVGILALFLMTPAISTAITITSCDVDDPIKGPSGIEVWVKVTVTDYDPGNNLVLYAHRIMANTRYSDTKEFPLKVNEKGEGRVMVVSVVPGSSMAKPKFPM